MAAKKAVAQRDGAADTVTVNIDSTSTSPPDPKRPVGPNGLSMVLRYAASDLRQGDLEPFMAAVNRSRLGVSSIEYNGKILRAAVESGWVIQPVLRVDKERDDVANLLPWQTAWYAKQIDNVYKESMNIPKA